MQPGTSDGRHDRRQRWENPLTDGWEFRWNVLVALPESDPDVIDAVLASIDGSQANTVVQLPPGPRTPRTPSSRNLAFAAAVPVRELVTGMDVVVVSGSTLSTLAAVRAGVPVVVLPTGPQQREAGREFVAAGAGVLVDTADQVGDAVRSVTTVPAHRFRARRLARRMRSVDLLLSMLGAPRLPLA